MKRLLPVLVLPLLLPACANTPDIASHLTPYKIDVRQGNMVTQDMVAQLKPGLTRDQVRFILGTPLVADMFHGDRWDYVYRFQPGRGEVQQRRLIVYFDGNKLVRLGGDVVANPPAEGEGPAKPASRVIDIPPAEGAVPAGTAPTGNPEPAK
jgi:outer membrane protein assembly factor BamE